MTGLNQSTKSSKLLVLAAGTALFLGWLWFGPRLAAKNQPVDSASPSPKSLPDYIEAASDPAAALEGGRQLYQRGDIFASEAAFARSSQLNPLSRDAWYHLGLARESQAKYFEAELAYRRARAIDPLYPLAHAGLIRVLEQQKETYLAKQAQDRLTSLEL